jgi:hypothetical protein
MTGSGTKGSGGLETVKLTGRVWVRAEPEQGKVTTATADMAFVDYAKTQEAVLSGSVRISSTDPSIFVGPATIIGDRAIISLQQNLAADEPRLRIESSPEKSRLEFTPKQTPAKTEEKK